tara:strand:- start:7370 stop:7924 length:555 start_codon:yes stop_codon:yes gene_type:complete
MEDTQAEAAPPPAIDAAEPPAMIKADLVTGLFFIVLAATTLFGALSMDRLEARRINPLTAPGLVPGLLGLALLVCGIILSLRSLRIAAPGGWTALGRAVTSTAAQRAGGVLVLTLTYALLLVGLLPFWLATGLFVFAFIMTFETWLATPRRPLLASMPWALGLAVVTATVVTLVFERLFLVRLP